MWQGMSNTLIEMLDSSIKIYKYGWDTYMKPKSLKHLLIDEPRPKTGIYILLIYWKWYMPICCLNRYMQSKTVYGFSITVEVTCL